MTSLLRAELLKLRSIPTSRGLFAAMVVLIVFAVALHALRLTPEQADSRSEQLEFIFRWGVVFGGLFAALLGALSITGEFRHGTIRPTLLITPRRRRIVAAKVVAGSAWGSAFGLIAAGLAITVATISLEARSIDVQLDAGDLALLVIGGILSAALWAAFGVGLGAMLRQQVATVAGLCTWMLFIESLLVSFVPDAGRLAPGAGGAALAGIDLDALLAPAVGGVLLLVYALVAVAVGALALTRRDVA